MSDFERFVGVWGLEALLDTSDLGEGFEGTEEKIFLEGNRAGEAAVRGGRAAVAAAGFESPVGLLIYLASGEMSVHFSGSARQPFLREFSPSPSELSLAGAAYGGYAGRWELDEPRRQVLHHAEVAFIPNRSGATIRRSYSFKENSSLLLLKPIPLSPREGSPKRLLVWRRRRAFATP